MSIMKIKNRKNDIEIEVEYEFPTTIEEASDKYGEEVILNRFNRQINQEIRALVIRNVILAKENGQDIDKVAKDSVKSFIPTVGTSSTVKAAKQIRKALNGLSAEEQAIIMKAIQGIGLSNGAAAEVNDLDPLASN